MRTVRSEDAVYSTPLPLSPPPPHRTTFTLAVCPPKVNSSLRVAIVQTLTVPSFEEDANRGAEGFLIPPNSEPPTGLKKTERFAHMCIGSQDKDMIHFECPFSASPRGFPVFGSHIRTFSWIRKGIRADGPGRVKKKTHMAFVSTRRQFSFESLPLDAQNRTFVARECVRWRFRE